MATIRQQMMELLADGEVHSRQELHALCGPSSLTAVAAHIKQLRSTLPTGEDIVCIIQGRAIFYRRVRLLASANRGYK